MSSRNNARSAAVAAPHHHNHDHRGPNQRHRHNHGHGSSQAPATHLEVYAPHFSALYRIPAHDVYHVPPAQLQVTRLVLCTHFTPQQPCPVGNRCKFVHADVSGAEVCDIHVNYAYRSLADVEYARFPSGTLLSVSQPNGKAPVVMIPSDCVLKTRALDAGRGKLSHCAHYYFNRTCHQGPNCQFVHAVYLDPLAKRFQRAPVPHTGTATEQGTTRSPSSCCEEDRTSTEDNASLTKAYSVATLAADRSAADDESASHCSGDDSHSASSVSASDVATQPGMLTPCRVQAASATGSASGHKYRFNPYDFNQAIVCV